MYTILQRICNLQSVFDIHIFIYTVYDNVEYIMECMIVISKKRQNDRKTDRQIHGWTMVFRFHSRCYFILYMLIQTSRYIDRNNNKRQAIRKTDSQTDKILPHITILLY